MVRPSSGLTEEEIQRILKEAEQFAEEDRRKKELAEARNQADSLIYSVEKTLRELGDKVPNDLRKEVEEKIKHLRETMDKDDLNAIRRASDELTQASYRLAEMLYRSKTQTGGEKAGTYEERASKKGGDEVTDADFEEMK